MTERTISLDSSLIKSTIVSGKINLEIESETNYD